MDAGFKGQIVEKIREFVREDEGNRLRLLDGAPIFDEPLVGFVAGDDPIFTDLKGIIGDFHLTPLEVMTRVADRAGAAMPTGMGVVVYVLPIAEGTREENAAMREGPSERWSHTRLFGEDLNRKLQRHLVSILSREGHLAIAPELDEDMFRILDDAGVGKASTWSQRHVAFAAGLGTFGLSDGLITERGIAHRIGSVVVDLPLDSPRRSDDIHGNCLFFQGGRCMTCARRCPVGAISEEGHDKQRCAEFVFGQETMIRERYGIDIHACGLCQTGVPCERGIPRGR